MAYKYKLPDLEERFLPPENWHSKYFLNPETGHQIHYNHLLSDSNQKKGTVICLPGLGEFGEKYIETAREFSSKGYDFYVIDWAYQGRSVRHKDTHRRHSNSYESDVSDLNYFIQNIVPSNDEHYYMLAHSMGANIGMRYLSKYPDQFNAASFSAAMLGIKSIKYIAPFVKFFSALHTKNHNKYVYGGKNWYAALRSSNESNIHSTDIIRSNVHNQWCLSNPELQVGSPTRKWLLESLKSITFLKNKNILQNIKIPILLAIAGQETIIDNKSIFAASAKIPNAKTLELPYSKHEILMETDDIRNKFIKETLKTFNL